MKLMKVMMGRMKMKRMTMMRLLRCGNGYFGFDDSCGNGYW